MPTLSPNQQLQVNTGIGKWSFFTITVRAFALSPLFLSPDCCARRGQPSPPLAARLALHRCRRLRHRARPLWGPRQRAQSPPSVSPSFHRAFPHPPEHLSHRPSHPCVTPHPTPSAGPQDRISHNGGPPEAGWRPRALRQAQKRAPWGGMPDCPVAPSPASLPPSPVAHVSCLFSLTRRPSP